MAEPKREPAAPRSRAPSGSRRRRLAIGFALVAVLAAIAVVVNEPWLPLRYGRAKPPVVPAETLEPALRRLLEDRTRDVAAAPYAAEAWGRLGVAYDVHDLPDRAIACYGRAHRLDPGDFRWIYFLGLCEMPSDHRAAQTHLLAARAIRDDYAPLELHIARGYFDTGELDRAEEHYLNAAKLDPKVVRPHVGLARVALARQQPGEALGHLEAALARGPKSGEVHFLLAQAHRRLGDDAEAARHAARAGERAAFEEFSDPVRMESQWDVGVTAFWRATRARAYLDSGMVDRAVGEWRAALEDDPASARAWAELGHLYAMGDPERAAEAYGRSLTLDPAQPVVRHRLGLLLLRSGRTDAGLRLVRESCEALPDRPDLRSNLAIALAGVGRSAEAADAFRTAARGFAAEGAYTRARQALESAFEKTPGDPAVAEDLAWLLATCPDEEVRDPARAQAVVAGFARDRTARQHDALGAALAAQGDFAGAIAAAQSALATPDLTPDERAAISSRLDGYREGRAFVDGRVPR